LRIKVNPEDFQVEEILSVPLLETGAAQRVYRLKKRNWNTVDALTRISDSKGVALRDLNWCGRKDKAALTVQYFSTSSDRDMTFKSGNVSAEFAGFAVNRLGPGSLSGNRFRIVLRDMDPREAEGTLMRLGEVKRSGFANYFDDQRFGDIAGGGPFIGELIVKRRFGEALKNIFTSCHPEAPAKTRKRKREIDRKWGKWEELAQLCPETNLKEMLDVMKKGKGELEALRKIPREEMGQYLSSYQSFLWNLVLAEIIRKTADSLFDVKFHPLDLVQFRRLPQGKIEQLAELEIPTAAAGMPEMAEDLGKTLSRVLYNRGVRLSKFRLPEIPQAYFSSFGRRAITIPEDLKWEEREDRLFPGKSMIMLEFSLPAGSFATMLIKSVSGGF